MKKLVIALTVALVVAAEVIAAMNYVRPSGSVELVSDGTVKAGDIVQVGESALVGVAMSTAPSGSVYVAYTRGIFEWAQDGTNAVAVGTTMYKAADSAAEVSVSTNSGLAVGVAVGTDGDRIMVDINNR